MASARRCCQPRARARASRPPSSADSSTARSRRRRRWGRAGSCSCSRRGILPRRCPSASGRRRRRTGTRRRWPVSRHSARRRAACRNSATRPSRTRLRRLRCGPPASAAGTRGPSARCATSRRMPRRPRAPPHRPAGATPPAHARAPCPWPGSARPRPCPRPRPACRRSVVWSAWDAASLIAWILVRAPTRRHPVRPAASGSTRAGSAPASRGSR